MSRTQPPDEVTDVIEWLRVNLDLSGVSAQPGAIDVDYPDYEEGVATPSVRVHSPETDTLGGLTGYSGMMPGGEGPTQDTRTTVQVDCWGGNEEDVAVLSEHPATVAEQLRSAVWGAVLDADPPPGYQYMSAVDSTTGHDTDATPPEYRQIVFVALGYTLMPGAATTQ